MLRRGGIAARKNQHLVAAQLGSVGILEGRQGAGAPDEFGGSGNLHFSAPGEPTAEIVEGCEILRRGDVGPYRDRPGVVGRRRGIGPRPTRSSPSNRMATSRPIMIARWRSCAGTSAWIGSIFGGRKRTYCVPWRQEASACLAFITVERSLLLHSDDGASCAQLAIFTYACRLAR